MAAGKTGPLDIPGRHIHQAFHPGAAAATATSSEILFVAPCACRIKAIKYVPSADIVGQDTDYFALDVINRGTDGSGTTSLVTAHTYNLAGSDATAGAAEEFTLSTTDATISLADGEVLAVKRTKTGNGLLMPSCLFYVEFEPK